MVNGGELLLLFDNVGAEYVSRISDGAKAASAASGFKTRSTNLYGRDEDVSDYLTDDAIAGVIVTPPISDDRPVLGKIEALGLPVVRIAPMLDLERGNIVTMDEYDAARAIAEHLLKHGHRRIGFIKGPRRHLVSIRRFNGFANALGGHGLKVDHDLIVEETFPAPLAAKSPMLSCAQSRVQFLRAMTRWQSGLWRRRESAGSTFRAISRWSGSTAILRHRGAILRSRRSASPFAKWARRLCASSPRASHVQVRGAQAWKCPTTCSKAHPFVSLRPDALRLEVDEVDTLSSGVFDDKHLKIRGKEHVGHA